ncbi:Hypothetical_protein [Hexamita inflata]|uniref:Hypothetical_protein n=1 Tax=Hexamita inflata TaxID=28002 RepID=A0AA86TJJ8_9EUKA|nr:Hypothetical protein HINF_LOCUS8309 [Hexamita inflata]
MAFKQTITQIENQLNETHLGLENLRKSLVILKDFKIPVGKFVIPINDFNLFIQQQQLKSKVDYMRQMTLFNCYYLRLRINRLNLNFQLVQIQGNKKCYKTKLNTIIQLNKDINEILMISRNSLLKLQFEVKNIQSNGFNLYQSVQMKAMNIYLSDLTNYVG